MTLINLNKKIVKCRSCNRLVNFREKIAKDKRRQYIDQTYWGKPITGYGDTNSKLLMIGLAPAAHGGNRTGRVLQVISQLIFFLIVFIRQDLQIRVIQSLKMMV